MLLFPPPKVAIRYWLLFICIGLFSLNANGQKAPQPDFPDELPSDDFGRTRDLTTAAEAFKFKKPVYRLKRKVPKPKRIQQATPGGKSSGSISKFSLPSDPKAEPQWETIGVTLWRVVKEPVPAGQAKETARLLIQQTGEQYTPIRANADTVFALGDEVRISVESPREGYLYIIDREMLGDEKLGEPHQIFPTMAARGGDNLVRPGMLVEIPGQSDAPFKLESNTSGYRGEMLTIIVSPVPLKDLGVPRSITKVPADLINEMEQRYLGDVGEYEQEGTAGMAYTPVEKNAGGSKTRQLVQGDPQPQTKYRVQMRPAEPLLINVSLNVK